MTHVTAWIARCFARLACLRDNFRADVDVLAGGGSLIRRTRTGSPWNEHTALPFAVWCGGSRSAASSRTTSLAHCRQRPTTRYCTGDTTTRLFSR